MNVPTPKWRFEWNPNTIAILLMFAITIGGWGYSYSDVVSGQESNTTAINELRAEVSELSSTQRVLDNHELRITTVETQARQTVTAMRAIEQSLSTLSADIRVMREILGRIEEAANR